MGRRVLVVDDNRDAADTLADLLVVLGHEARAVYDGDAAIAAATGDFAPEMVFLDIGLPGKDGYEVARSIRSSGVSVQLIALTGFEPAAARPEFDRFLRKPVKLATLQSILEG